MALTLDEIIAQTDLAHITTNSARQEVIELLTPVVRSMHIDPEEKSQQIEGKMMIIDTLLKTLDAKDKAETSRVNIRLKQKDSTTTEHLGQLAAEILRRTTLSTKPGDHGERGTVDLNKCAQDLDSICRERGVIVTETELIDDPNDV